MGYYTDFEIQTLNNDLTPEKDQMILEAIKFHIEKISTYDFCGVDVFSLNGKWYEWNEDMRKLSKMYPDYIFQVDGHGEDYTDVWRQYFKDGKFHQSKVITKYEEYDESRLT